jgi:deferrochelatase/peroxidase EfeB
MDTQDRLAARAVGEGDCDLPVETAGGRRDQLTDFTRAVTGAYYFVPASEALAMFAAEPAEPA